MVFFSLGELVDSVESHTQREKNCALVDTNVIAAKHKELVRYLKPAQKETQNTPLTFTHNGQ